MTIPITRTYSFGAVLVFLLALSACSSRVSIDKWQDEFDWYLQEEANGDAAFLRQGTPGGEPGQFAVIGGSSPDKSTDVTGVFLGRRNMQDRPWLIFLVGSIKKREVEEIHVALRSDDNRPARWIISRENSAATTSYRRHRQRLWRAQHPGRSDPPINALTFPGEGDVFDLEVAGNTASIMHRESGARWTAVVDAPRTPRTARAASATR